MRTWKVEFGIGRVVCWQLDALRRFELFLRIALRRTNTYIQLVHLVTGIAVELWIDVEILSILQFDVIQCRWHAEATTRNSNKDLGWVGSDVGSKSLRHIVVGNERKISWRFFLRKIFVIRNFIRYCKAKNLLGRFSNSTCWNLINSFNDARTWSATASKIIQRRNIFTTLSCHLKWN